jgi:hypothetical protein
VEALSAASPHPFVFTLPVVNGLALPAMPWNSFEMLDVVHQCMLSVRVPGTFAASHESYPVHNEQCVSEQTDKASCRWDVPQ